MQTETDTIDIQKYLSVAVRHWRAIAAITIGAAIVALIVSLLTPPTYEATALVVVASPLYQLQFDPRIQNVTNENNSSPNKAFPQLATSDALLQRLLSRFRPQLSDPGISLDTFKDSLNAKAGADPSVIQLVARDTNPRLAADIGNAWATDFVAYVNELYQQREAGVTFFETQVNEAKTKLDHAEQALIDFQGQYDGSVINSKLQASLGELSDALKTRASLATLIANVDLLTSRLANQPATAPARLADDLSSLLLQVSGLGVANGLPLQMQFADSTLLSSKTVGEQKALLVDLSAVLRARAEQVDARINALQPQIRSLQRDLQSANAQLDQLTRDRNTARDTYLTLTQKVTEAQISAQDATGQLRVASQAAMPTDPVGPKKALNSALAAMLGLIVGLVVAYLQDIRQARLQPTPKRSLPQVQPALDD